MFRFDAALRVYVHREPIDFRAAGMNSLVTLVEQPMQLDPFAGAVYVEVIEHLVFDLIVAGRFGRLL